jgi:alkanesulfonate monooxygenase SsuD/methylene tetrahydromethanopterin reductase-like flavin-dependent oxidoreductase (luciferase family)
VGRADWVAGGSRVAWQPADLRPLFDRIALADSLGFDVAWLAELHSGGAFSMLSSQLMVV